MVSGSAHRILIQKLWNVPDLFFTVGFLLACMVLYVSPFAAWLNYLFPAGAFFVGLDLYFRNKMMYLGYSWWIVMLVPLARRLIDYRCGWSELSPVLLAPFLVLGLSSISVLRCSAEFKRDHLKPFFLILGGLFYSYLIGVIKVGFLPASFALLEWCAPVIFAIHLLIHWREYDVTNATLRRVFAWGLLVMGLYGILQYLVLFPWDSHWMISSRMYTQGLPYPFYVRVFSTMNSSLPLACFLLGLLILKPEKKGKSAYAIALIPGFITFLLSLVRCAWGGWFVAVGYIAIMSRKTRLAKQLVWSMSAFVLLIVIMFLVPPIYDAVTQRAMTFEKIGDDVSYIARLDFHREFLGESFSNILGGGLGSVGSATRLTSDGGFLGELAHFDSGILMLPYVLGWPGLFLYLAGLGLLILDIFLLGTREQRVTLISYQALVLAFLAMMLFGNVLISQCGMMFWAIVGLARAYLCFARQERRQAWETR
jgi:hypothetical protein